MPRKKYQSRIALTSALGMIVLLLIGAIIITIAVWSPQQTTQKENQELILQNQESRQEQESTSLQKDKQPKPQQPREQQEELYVFLEANKELLILDPKNDRIQERISLPEEPVAAFLHVADSKIYIAHTKIYAISVFDLRTKKVMQKIELKAKPSDLIMAKGLLYILLPDLNQVLVVDPKTEGIEKEIDVNKEPQHIFFAEKSNKIFVTSKRPETLTTINPNIRAIADVLNLDNPPFILNINPTERYYYITDDIDNQLMIIPIKAVKQERSLQTEIKPHSITFTPDDRIILVTNEGSNTVSLISTLQERVLQNIDVGISPTSIVVTADGKKAYVANQKDSTVSVIDIAAMKKMKDILVGKNPVKLLMSSS